MLRRENLRELKNCKVIPRQSVATQHRMLVMEMKTIRKIMSPRETIKRTRSWKLNHEVLNDAFISKAREHICSLEVEGKETNWKETYSRIIQLAKEELGESTPESIWRKSHGGGMMQCSRRCLRKGGGSENGTEREKKTTRSGTRRQTKNAKGL